MGENDVFALIVIVMGVFVVGMIYAISREGDSQRQHDKEQREADRRNNDQIHVGANNLIKLQFETMINAMKESLGMMQGEIIEVTQETKEGLLAQSQTLGKISSKQDEQLALQKKDGEITMETKELIQAIHADLENLKTRVAQVEATLSHRLEVQDKVLAQLTTILENLLNKIEGLQPHDKV
jgi:hypothetical protein